MDILEYIIELLDLVGYAGAMSLLCLAIVFMTITMFSKQMKALSDSVTTITDKVSAPYLDPEQSKMVFKVITKTMIQEELEYLGGVLEREALQERKDQIKKNIEREFKRIILDHAGDISTIHSVSGDMGKIIQNNIDWEKLLPALYAIFFHTENTRHKIMDIKILLTDITDSMAVIVAENGAHN